VKWLFKKFNFKFYALSSDQKLLYYFWRLYFKKITVKLMNLDNICLNLC